jgi:hypothetical protein
VETKRVGGGGYWKIKNNYNIKGKAIDIAITLVVMVTEFFVEIQGPDWHC